MMEHARRLKYARLADTLRRRSLDAGKRDTRPWRFGIAGVSAAWLCWCVVLALGMPSGFGAAFDIAAFALGGMLALGAVGYVLAWLLALAAAPVPRLFAGSAAAAGTGIGSMLYVAETGWTMTLIWALGSVLSGAGLGLAIGALPGNGSRAAYVWKLPLLAASVAAIAIAGRWLLDHEPAKPAEPFSIEASLRAEGNPAAPGTHEYRFFTYGSGTDQLREAYGKATDLRTEPVDGSAYVRDWPWLRKLVWGFGPSELPLNGRVWMPEGEGPFPLVLMVHGNHLAEDFSDAGYDYLGELLASRGIIAVSVDENFLNYSAWTGIPDEDMKPRAWLLLKHLQQIAAFAAAGDNPFSGKVDGKRIGLLGHSRGGQAVAMAADYERWFGEDDSLAGIEDMSIAGVAALAPTDMWVDDEKARLRNVSYLAIQGAKDADLISFYGDRQYMRTTFAPGSEGFKAALYVVEANHSQFNETWGVRDFSMPVGLFLNLNDMMAAEHQRHIAKAYVSAFFEAVLLGRDSYDALLQDARNGAEWLPAYRYLNRYESGRFRPIARFEEDRVRATGLRDAAIEAEGFDAWREEQAEDRERGQKPTYGVVLQWSGAATYSIRANTAFAADPDSALAFSMADMARDLESSPELPFGGIHVAVRDASGRIADMPLSDVADSPSVPPTIYAKSKAAEREMKKGKFKEAVEPVFRTYRIPLERFMERNPEWRVDEWTAVEFRFLEGTGKVMLDDIGIEPGSVAQ